MIKAGVPDSGRPYNTYFEEARDFPFNGEPVLIYHPASANTDTESIVMFRRSDVIATGDVFRTDSFPIDRPRERRHHAGRHRRAQPHPRR